MIKTRKIYSMLVIAFLLFLNGCETGECPDCSSGPSPESLEEAVETNCLIVQAAAKEFAARNGGSYPIDALDDSTDTGLTLINLLPDGERLVNPFTGQSTEPVDRRAAYPGEVGYEEDDYYGYCPGYTITGCGWDSVIVVLTNLDALDDSVRANCYRVQQAAERFASLNCGCYALTTCDITWFGKSLIALLPGGTYLKNPFNGYFSEPIDDAACHIGGTGYTVVNPEGWAVGYVINGVGHDATNIIMLTNVGSSEEASVRTNCIIVLNSAGRFAISNDGIFPRDIDTDTNLDGDTLLDLIMFWSQDDLLYNPYTRQRDQPVDRRASNPGETGYEAVLEGGSAVRCIVTGVGATAGNIIAILNSSKYLCP